MFVAVGYTHHATPRMLVVRVSCAVQKELGQNTSQGQNMLSVIQVGPHSVCIVPYTYRAEEIYVQ